MVDASVLIDVRESEGPEEEERPPRLDDLPDEVLCRVLSLLSARQVSALAPCSRRWRRACSQPYVWAALLRRDFDDEEEEEAGDGGRGAPLRRAGGESEEAAVERGAELRAAYGRRYQAVMKDRKERLSRKDRARVADVRAAGDKRLYRAFVFYHMRVVHGSLPALLFVATLLAALHLDGKGGVTAGHVFVPLWMFAAVVAVGVVSLGAAHSWRRLRRARGRHHATEGCMPSISDELVRYTLPGRLLALAVLLCLALFLAFLHARLTGAVSWPYAAVFAPLWCAFPLLCAAPCAGWVESYKRTSFFVGSWLGLLPLLAVLALAVARLDGKDGLTLALVFVPFWVVNAVVLGLPLAVCVAGLVGHYSPVAALRCDAFASRSTVLDYVRVLLLSWFLFLPAFLFELLLALRDAGGDGTGRDYTDIFAPLLAWEAVYVLIGLASAFVP